MPALDNIRHERFARALIKTGVKCKAYLKAGYTPTTRSGLDAAASRLARRGKIASRIRELKKQMAARQRITVDSLCEELDEARVLAVASGQPSAAVSASMSKAKLVGLLVDRKEIGEPGAFTQSEAEVLARVAAELGADAASALASALEKASRREEEAAAPPADDPPPLPTRTPGDTLN